MSRNCSGGSAIIDGKLKSLEDVKLRLSQVTGQLVTQLRNSFGQLGFLPLIQSTLQTTVDSLTSTFQNQINQISSVDGLLQLPGAINATLTNPNLGFPSNVLPTLSNQFQSINWTVEILKVVNFDKYFCNLTVHAQFWTEINIQNIPGITQQQMDALALLVEIPNAPRLRNE